MSVIECVVALSVLAAMLSVVVSIQVVQSARIGLAKQKLIAEQTLNNLAQRVISADESEVVEDTIGAWAQEFEDEQGLPSETIQVEVSEVSKPAAGKRVVLTWKPSSPQLPEYSLVTWRFDQAPAEVSKEQP
ncbi:hypothetical protein [Bremerella sp.]|uniref:hypothetical protein n=1 Tax=Bremerella sp. TaxID=2795602 RepID=UPI003918CD2D